jgi:hypothetical protein
MVVGMGCRNDKSAERGVWTAGCVVGNPCGGVPGVYEGIGLML